MKYKWLLEPIQRDAANYFHINSFRKKKLALYKLILQVFRDTLKRGVNLEYIRAEYHVFNIEKLKVLIPNFQVRLTRRHFRKLTNFLDPHLKIIWKTRSKSLKKKYPEYNRDSFIQNYVTMIYTLLQYFPEKLFIEDFIETWSQIVTLEEDNFHENFGISQFCGKMMLCETPSNAEAERCGRICNMSRSVLRRRMRESTLDVNSCVYKNSVGLQFWEAHMDNLVFTHLHIVGGNLSIPTQSTMNPYDRFDKTKERQKRKKVTKSNRITKQVYDVFTKSKMFTISIEIPERKPEKQHDNENELEDMEDTEDEEMAI